MYVFNWFACCPPYKRANPALRIVLIVWRVPSMIHPLRRESNARLSMFLRYRLSRINILSFFFFFFRITISVGNRNWISKNPLKGLMNCAAPSMKVPNVGPVSTFFAFKKRSGQFLRRCWPELLSKTALFFF